jgi:hypothetical protein
MGGRAHTKLSRGVRRAAVALEGALCALVVGTCAVWPGSAGAHSQRTPSPTVRSHNAGRARLVVQISGLPRGSRPLALISGPAVNRRLRLASTTLSVRPGRYRLTLNATVVRTPGRASGARFAMRMRPRPVALPVIVPRP